MEKNKHGLVVIVENDKPIGILTERDIIGIVGSGANLNNNLRAYCNKDIITVQNNRDVAVGSTGIVLHQFDKDHHIFHKFSLRICHVYYDHS